MAYPYPPHHPDLPYVGKQHYFLTFSTDHRSTLFTTSGAVDVALSQFLRAAREQHFEMTAYCFMPDHAHVLVRGLTERSDAKAFIKAAKQYSGYYFKQKYGRRLWQRYGFERVVRDDVELAFVIRYIVGNPVRAGLVDDPTAYPFLGSERYSVIELMEIGEYRRERLPERDLPPEGGSHGRDLPPEGGSHGRDLPEGGSHGRDLPPEGGSHGCLTECGFRLQAEDRP